MDMNNKITAEAEETFDSLAKNIAIISDNFEKISQTPLKRDTIVMLLQNAIWANNITKKHINLVLNILPSLKKIYLK